MLSLPGDHTDELAVSRNAQDLGQLCNTRRGQASVSNPRRALASATKNFRRGRLRTARMRAWMQEQNCGRSERIHCHTKRKPQAGYHLGLLSCRLNLGYWLSGGAFGDGVPLS
jgi:hypothetical protein